jgi:hypothetical protein
MIASKSAGNFTAKFPANLSEKAWKNAAFAFGAAQGLIC